MAGHKINTKISSLLEYQRLTEIIETVTSAVAAQKMKDLWESWPAKQRSTVNNWRPKGRWEHTRTWKGEPTLVDWEN